MLSTAVQTPASAISPSALPENSHPAAVYEDSTRPRSLGPTISPPIAAWDLSSLFLAVGKESSAIPQPPTSQRLMGDTELSYYLPSRADGVNDMYLHLGFSAPRRLLAPQRVLAAWTLLLLRHPPLAARVIPPPSAASPFGTDYSQAKFSYTAPASPAEALSQASANLELRKDQSKDELIDQYLNGDRILGDDKLSCLILSENASSAGEDMAEYNILVCAVHFLGDGMALHRFANELFTLLAEAGTGETLTAEDYEELLRNEWEAKWGSARVTLASVLPPAVEDSLAPVTGKLRKAAVKVDFLNSSRKDIGGHSLPRAKGNQRKTLVPTTAFDAVTTRAILKKCKAQGVSISNALFALSALAWSRVQQRDRNQEFRKELPIMMYSALNLRPYLRPCDLSYWFVSVGFFNVVLPSFLPSPKSREDERMDNDTLHSTFWHRARVAKAQSSRAAKHPMLVSRTHETAKVRSKRAQTFAAEDDARSQGIPVPSVIPSSTPTVVEPSAAPSMALLGLSLLGNLDGIYTHKTYPALQLHTLTTGSRQREGALLVFGYTFVGKLWLSLGYDVNGFKEGVVDAWWKEVLDGVKEFLIV
ncbi:hypothetical protein M407DRAFT_212016 [Tulasnella calospora MUT 4182]|uniref:Condensation domain-containing protein n=1 Tax=Tulasnella calospora MUT 4182 TaxID=1051891 RepID=A0A0C3QGS4_9AGAM|nr:hypothetical protein M407DRAFT_212016 [Tulasnella calospora MUT 4182]